MTSPDLLSATFLQELVDGASRLPLPDGERMSLYGPVLARANLSAWPVKEQAPTTPDTCGPSSDASLRTSNLQKSLESRLRARMDVDGSPEYVLTWKQWDMESGPPICALRASARPISDNAFGGWPTPRREDSESTGGHRGVLDTLTSAARVAGWATPCNRDHRHANLKPWNQRGGGKKGEQLNNQVVHLLGQTTYGFPAQTGKRGVLNPDLPRWLMGYPAVWGLLGATATRSARR